MHCKQWPMLKVANRYLNNIHISGNKHKKGNNASDCNSRVTTDFHNTFTKLPRNSDPSDKIHFVIIIRHFVMQLFQVAQVVGFITEIWSIDLADNYFQCC